MLPHTFENGVLVVALPADVGVGDRSALSTGIARLAGAHAPAPVVVEIDTPADGAAAVSAVVRAHRMCARLGVAMCVATPGAATRRLLQANSDTSAAPLGVHASTAAAVAAVAVPAAPPAVRGDAVPG